MDESKKTEADPTIDVSAAVDAETDSPFSPGKVLDGKYRIDKETGRGELCAVVAARHLQLDQLVAIKYVQGDARKNPSVLARFLREARQATKVRSDHAVHVHDVLALPDGTSYIVMDHLEGMDLKKILEGGPLLVKRAIDYILQACDALAEAHVAGVLHGDLRPENVFLARKVGGTTIKLLDFGLALSDAKKGDSARARELASQDRLATPAYMAPEQLTPQSNIDERADIWALGVLLYELVSGTPPFGASPSEAVCKAIAEGAPVPLADVLPNAPEGLEPILLRCLTKNREERYQNVAELAVALAPLAAPSTRPLIEHIARVIGDDGGHVPSLPLPVAAAPLSLPIHLPVGPPEPSGGTGGVASSFPPAAFRPRRNLLKIVPVAVVAAALGVAILVRGSLASKPSPAPAAPTAPTAPVVAQAATGPAPVPASPPPPLPQEVPAASSTPAPTNPVPPPAAPKKRYDSKGAPAGSSGRPKPATPDPDALLNPFN